MSRCQQCRKFKVADGRKTCSDVCRYRLVRLLRLPRFVPFGHNIKAHRWIRKTLGRPRGPCGICGKRASGTMVWSNRSNHYLLDVLDWRPAHTSCNIRRDAFIITQMKKELTKIQQRVMSAIIADPTISYTDLEKKTRLMRGSVQQAVRALVKKGWLEDGKRSIWVLKR